VLLDEDIGYEGMTSSGVQLPELLPQWLLAQLVGALVGMTCVSYMGTSAMEG
jgi:hypothetical protein